MAGPNGKRLVLGINNGARGGYFVRVIVYAGSKGRSEVNILDRK